MAFVPKYAFLVNWIKDQILHGDLNCGDRLYSENELCSIFDVSRQTVRQAIGILEQEGVVTRRRGSGTYILWRKTHGRTGTKKIGVISTYVGEYIFMDILRAVESVLSGQGYVTQVSFTRNDPENERRALRSMLDSDVDGVIVESNTSYGGRRASNALHHQVVKDHGFLDIAEFDLLDEEGTMDIPVGPAAVRLERNIVGSHFDDYDSYLVLSHFKGHAMAGFGGAIKNLSIGFGSGQSAPESGKVYIHTGGERTRGNIYGEQIPFLEAMAEAAQAVCNYMDGGKNTAFVNVLNRLSVDCDCNGNPAEPDMHDIGILASTDPLAIDQAAIDLVFTAPDSASLVERIDSRQGRHVLEHAQAIGLGAGTRSYRLVVID